MPPNTQTTLLAATAWTTVTGATLAGCFRRRSRALAMLLLTALVCLGFALLVLNRRAVHEAVQQVHHDLLCSQDPRAPSPDQYPLFLWASEHLADLRRIAVLLTTDQGRVAFWPSLVDASDPDAPRCNVLVAWALRRPVNAYAHTLLHVLHQRFGSAEGELENALFVHLQPGALFPNFMAEGRGARRALLVLKGEVQLSEGKAHRGRPLAENTAHLLPASDTPDRKVRATGEGPALLLVLELVVPLLRNRALLRFTRRLVAGGKQHQHGVRALHVGQEILRP